MTKALPTGFTLRPGRADDVEPVTAALVAEERALRGESEWSAVDTLDWWRGLEDHGEAWVVDDSSGGVAAVLGLFQRGDRFDGWIAVEPRHNSRGLDSAFVEYAEERVKARGGRSLMLGALAENVVAQQLFERAGYRVVRHFYRMKIELDGRPPDPDWPNGVACTTFDPADARSFHDAVSDAFADNWDFRPMEFEAWKRHRLEAPDFDPTLWFVAREGAEIAGVARCESKRWGGGWVAMLGVRKRWRRRGLGLALLRRTFCEFYDRGERRVGLGVDAENPTGATRLYERAGMQVDAEDVIFEKELG
jgi:mycothiol synthase